MLERSNNSVTWFVRLVLEEGGWSAVDGTVLDFAWNSVRWAVGAEVYGAVRGSTWRIGQETARSAAKDPKHPGFEDLLGSSSGKGLRRWTISIVTNVRAKVVYSVDGAARPSRDFNADAYDVQMWAVEDAVDEAFIRRLRSTVWEVLWNAEWRSTADPNHPALWDFLREVET